MSEAALVNCSDEIPADSIQHGAAATNGLLEDSDCEDFAYFTQAELDDSKKCFENILQVIKDFELQIDFHVEQYNTLRNIQGQISRTISDNDPDVNTKFIKSRRPIFFCNPKNDDELNSEEDFDESEDVDDPIVVKPKRKGRGRRGKKAEVEFDEDEHESPKKRRKNTKSATKKVSRGKRPETIDLTKFKECKVILNRLQKEDSQEVIDIDTCGSQN